MFKMSYVSFLDVSEKNKAWSSRILNWKIHTKALLGTKITLNMAFFAYLY